MRQITLPRFYNQARTLYCLGDWDTAQDQKDEAARCYQHASALWSAIGLADLVEQILTLRLQAVSEGRG